MTRGTRGYGDQSFATFAADKDKWLIRIHPAHPSIPCGYGFLWGFISCHCLHLIDGNMVYGWRLLLVAWYGFLIMQIPWLANVFFFVGMFLLRNDRTYRYAGFLGFSAFAVGLLSYRSKVWIAHHTLIDHLGSGFYVWMTAFLILASFVWVPNKNKSVDRDVSDKKET